MKGIVNVSGLTFKSLPYDLNYFLCCLCFAHLQVQFIHYILDIWVRFELGNLCRYHHHKQVYNSEGIFAQNIKSLSAILLESSEIGWFLTTHNLCILRSKGYGSSLPFDVELGFEISQEMSKINVEKLSVFLDHDIARMSITNSHDICPYQISNTWPKKILFCHQQISSFIMVLQIR